MATIPEALQLADRHFRTGNLPEAERVYRLVLEADPKQADALRCLGVIAAQGGRLADATDLLRQAVAVKPDDAEAFNTLGVVLCGVGDFEGSAAAFRQALEIAPNNAEIHDNLGTLFTHQGRFAEAAKCHRAALNLNPASPPTLAKLGSAMLHQGKLDEATAHFREAIRLQPRSAPAHLNLGTVLQRQGKWEEAATCYGETLRLDPRSAHARFNLGQVLQLQGQLDEALRCFQEAQRLAPKAVDLGLAVATKLEQQGKLKDAVASYGEVLRLDPACAKAYYRLSELARDGHYQFTDVDIDRIRELLAHADPAPMEASLLNFALANALDRRGDYDQAFACFRQGNELRRGLFQKAGGGFDPETNRRIVSDVMATFTPAYFERVRSMGSESARPVFVVGMPRSGTTLVEQILASHPAVHGAGEIKEIARAIAAFASADSPYPACMANVEAATVAREAGGYLERSARSAPEVLRIVDKLPENFLHLGVIATLFPRAHIIHCRRDPMDVCLSCYVQNFEETNFTFTLEDIASYFRQYERLMAHWRQALPIPIFEVQYEDLVTNPEPVSRAMIAYCGLEWNESCLSFHQTRRVVQTASQLQVRRPAHTGSIARWKRYASHLQPLAEALAAPS